MPATVRPAKAWACRHQHRVAEECRHLIVVAAPQERLPGCRKRPILQPGRSSPINTQSGTNARQPITGNTQGVIGLSNLHLSKAANAAEGSIVSSEKSNVKLDSGTLLLLRVSQISIPHPLQLGGCQIQMPEVRCVEQRRSKLFYLSII